MLSNKKFLIFGENPEYDMEIINKFKIDENPVNTIKLLDNFIQHKITFYLLYNNQLSNDNYKYKAKLLNDINYHKDLFEYYIVNVNQKMKFKKMK